MTVMAKGGVPETIDLTRQKERENVLKILQAIHDTPDCQLHLEGILRSYPHSDGTYAKSQLLGAYVQLVEEGAFLQDPAVEHCLRGRPVRTISGVAPVAVLTEPYPCPGECIFCPNQAGAPKSYLDGEPGVLRAIQNHYDPYEQTHMRIRSLEALGHATDKIELLILGGTWSYYPAAYREHFLRRCFDAMNETVSETLPEALLRNETSAHRNVGIVIETRPDWVSPQEVLSLRREGVTKVQIGVQSCNEQILALNHRGHTLEDVFRAFRLLRLAGFKIVMHWMPNLYGATPDSDLEDFCRLWDNPALRPDEIKIYPTALLEDTELYALWEKGRYVPYAEETLVDLLIQCKQRVPQYSRINRLMRDIPAQYIVSGTTKSNLRQIVQDKMQKQGVQCQCIRCREIRGKEKATADSVHLDVLTYDTEVTREHFLQYLTPQQHLAGFLRLSIPKVSGDESPIAEVRGTAMIRELHVYGPALALGARGGGGQHHGLGTELLEHAAGIAREAGFSRMAVIAAVGTRPYYRERGFVEGELYLIRNI